MGNQVLKHHLQMHMPAEWEPHRGMLMQWPVSEVVWGENLQAARRAFSRVARAIACFEPLTMIANPGLAKDARKQCGDKVAVLELPHDDCWVRDNGPTFLKEERLIAVDWKFNAWGEIYPCFALDDTIPARLCRLWDIPCLEAPLVLEGGSIHSNGRGLILTTEECLLNPNRNPALTKDQIEETLLQYLGARRVIWLPFGLYGDETSGHVDNICCFLDAGTVLLHWTEDAADPDYHRVRKAQKILLENGLGIEKIPKPPVRFHKGRPLTMSYVNFVFVNQGLILPGFGGPAQKTDKIARGTMGNLFPDREILQLPTMDIVKGGGNIHCITQQIPL